MTNWYEEQLKQWLVEWVFDVNWWRGTDQPMFTVIPPIPYNELANLTYD